MVACVPGLESRRQVLLVGEPGAGGQPVRHEVAGHSLQQAERLRRLSPAQQQAPELAARDRVVGVDLERAAQRVLVAAADQRVGLRRHQPRHEALDYQRRLRAGELVDDLAVAERLHGRQPAHAVARGSRLVAVGVELGELDLAGVRVNGLLDHRREHVTGLAPVGPEVHEHRELRGAVQHALLEVGVGDLDRLCHAIESSEGQLLRTVARSITTGCTGVPASPLAGSPSSPIASTTSCPFTTLPSRAYSGGRPASAAVTT
jgi:hypothetical protein